MLRYRIDVVQALKDRGFSSYRIRRDKLIGEREMTKIRAGQLVSWNVFDKICELLQCQPGDIVEYIDEAMEHESQ